MPNTQCKKCRHGYIAEMCDKDHPSQIIPCKDVPTCPVIDTDETRYPVMLTQDQMRFLRGVMADMSMLPVIQEVRQALNEGETAATIRRAEKAAYDAAPFHVCDCGIICGTKEGFDRLCCPRCDSYR